MYYMNTLERILEAQVAITRDQVLNGKALNRRILAEIKKVDKVLTRLGGGDTM